MKKNSILDYSLYALLKLFGPVIRILPLDCGLWLGRALGGVWHYLDSKHRMVVYSNIKTAFGRELPVSCLKKIVKDFYLVFGQNLFEIFYIPLIDKNYLKKYFTIEGMSYIDEAFKRGKGVVFVGIHEGAWELSNIVSANLGFPFFMFVQDQKLPLLSKLLNSYRRQKGCQFIQRENQLRQLIRIFKENQSVGMTIDQGGKDGLGVKFFAKDASMSTGAVRLALKYDIAIIPVISVRIKGHYKKIIIEKPFILKKTDNLEFDIRDNLERLVGIFEKYIRLYPHEYLWSYKIWKYSKERNVLILNDGKAGHLRQSQSLGNIVAAYFKDKQIKTNIAAVEVKFKNKFSKPGLILSCLLASKYSCQGCLWCLSWFLPPETRKLLVTFKPDIIISCGSGLAGLNLILSRENLAKSLVIMRPSVFSLSKFDLAIIPKHDNPPRRKNVVITNGALNLIDKPYLIQQSDRLISLSGSKLKNDCLYIGLLIGGDTKDFILNNSSALEVIRQLKSSAEEINAELLVTTSRRTSIETERLIKKELEGYFRCKLLIIANENNIPEAVGGILALSRIIVVSPESISMVSEAASSQGYTVVFDGQVNIRHRIFLNNLSKDNYIYIARAEELASQIKRLWKERLQVVTLDNNSLVKEALKKAL